MTGTSAEVIETLRQRVHSSPALQAQLFAVTDPQEFVAVVRQVALAFDLALSDEEVLQAMRMGRRAWSDRKLA
jgi:hypothetical protein